MSAINQKLQTIKEKKELPEEESNFETPQKKRTPPQHVQTTFVRSIKKLTRSFVTEPIIRLRSKAIVNPIRMKTLEEAPEFAKETIEGGSTTKESKGLDFWECSVTIRIVILSILFLLIGVIMAYTSIGN